MFQFELKLLFDKALSVQLKLPGFVFNHLVLVRSPPRFLNVYMLTDALGQILDQHLLVGHCFSLLLVSGLDLFESAEMELDLCGGFVDFLNLLGHRLELLQFVVDVTLLKLRSHQVLDLLLGLDLPE